MKTNEATQLRPRGYEHKLLIDVWEAADLLGLKVSRVRMAVFRQEIPYRKIGGMVRFVPEELREWINSGSFVAGAVVPKRRAE